MAATVRNNVECNKRVSFIAEEQVHTFLSDNISNDDLHISSKRPINRRLSFTEVDAPPARVMVHSGDSEIPRPISPPAQIENSTPVSTDIAASASIMSFNSPAMPSFITRREKDCENPFKPEDLLYNEVNPIIEAYKNRPFPPSNKNSPIPSQKSTEAYTPATSQQQVLHLKGDDIDSSTPKRTDIRHINGSRSASLAEVRREIELTNSSNVKSYQVLPQPEQPPTKPEIVHLEGKKRRKCCSLQ